MVVALEHEIPLDELYDGVALAQRIDGGAVGAASVPGPNHHGQ
jgi:hypothetical protein